MKSSHWATVAGLALFLPAWCGLMFSPVPTVICPFPALTVIPAFLLSSARVVWPAALVPPVLFFPWNPGLVQGQAKVPMRSLALLALLTVLTVLWFVGDWQFGLRYQGLRFTRAVCGINIGWLIVLWVAMVRGHRKPQFITNLLAHWLMFAWLGWYAFPYLGELP
jgi:hypothetical protein